MRNMLSISPIAMRNISQFFISLLIISTIGALTVSGCGSQDLTYHENVGRTKIFLSTPKTNSQLPSPTIPIPTNTPIKHLTHSEPVQTSDIPGCRMPSENYGKVEINEHILNKRTVGMLTYAQSLYDGIIDVTGDAITQGSYANAVEASFGTHAGGGAVDLSVMTPGTYNILYEDIEPLVQALRLAGFAAWYRDFNELYDGSPPHIHAIAVGDSELSMAAREQLAGPFGYFWGYNGLPTEDKVPIRDPHGGPVVCEWMIEKGYPNKTATPSPLESMP